MGAGFMNDRRQIRESEVRSQKRTTTVIPDRPQHIREQGIGKRE